MPEKVLIISPNCPTCEVLKATLERQGVLDKVIVVDVSTAEGKDFAQRLGVKAVPECAVIEGAGDKKTVRVCSDAEWNKLLETGNENK